MWTDIRAAFPQNQEKVTIYYGGKCYDAVFDSASRSFTLPDGKTVCALSVPLQWESAGRPVIKTLAGEKEEARPKRKLKFGT